LTAKLAKKKDEWINVIKEEMIKLKEEIKKNDNNIIFEVKLKKRMITDLYNLPNIFGDKLEVKMRLELNLIKENCFLPKKIKDEKKKKNFCRFK